MVEVEHNMLDVEVPAGVDPAGGRAARSGGATWVEERRPLLILGAFGFAIMLGIVLGLAWAPDDGSGSEEAGVAAPTAAEVQPPLPEVAWEGQRQEGRAQQMVVLPEQRDRITLPLRALAAYEVRLATGADIPVTDDVTIPDGGMYYGAIEGADRLTDEFWAVSETEIAGIVEQPADPHVWRRIGADRWTLVAHGPGACNTIPQALKDVWGGNPTPCST